MADTGGVRLVNPLKHLLARKPRQDAAAEQASDQTTGDWKLKMSEAEFACQELFISVPAESIARFLQHCTRRDLEDGDALLQHGTQNQDLYLILSGHCKVYLPFDSRNPVAKLKAGQSVGEISLIDHQPTTAQVVSEGKTSVLVMPEKVAWALLRSSRHVALNMLTVLTSRLRDSDALLTAIKETSTLYRHSALIDPLTNLHNRRWLSSMLPRVMQRHVSDRKPLSLLMMDIDHFKTFNDTHGHPAGDSALRTVAKILLQKLRPEDVVTRYGGEEMLAVLPNTDTEGALPVAERLRAAIHDTPVELPEKDAQAPLTISIGLATMQADQTPTQFIAVADRALYRAKTSGRDRVVAADAT